MTSGETTSATAEIRVGLSLMPSEDFRVATESLFQLDLIDVLEWNVDMGFGHPPNPPWVEALLDRYSERDRLYAHGVELSPLSAVLLPHQEKWLAELARTFERRRYLHLTDHFGFMTAGSFVRGTPLPLPQSRAALAVAEERIRRLRSIADCPVGLENLALAFGLSDVRAQPAFLREALEKTDGFLLLDLHNLHCQAQNFGEDAHELLLRYPLDRVKEIHVAGGSLSHPRSDPEGRPFRRDSHDSEVPSEVFALLSLALKLCPELEAVILERTDRSMFGDEERRRFGEEFIALRELVHATRPVTPAPIAPSDDTQRAPRNELAVPWIEDDVASLDTLQRSILETFEKEADPRRATLELRSLGALQIYDDWLATWEPRAVEIGITLVRQWGTRASTEGTMLAAVLPAPNGTFELRHVPIVEPGPGQALLRIRASGICGTDIHIRRGTMGIPLPAVLGHEPVGVVEAVGPMVTNVSVGDRVGVPWVQAGCQTCASCRRGKTQYCTDPKTWMQNGGGHAELMLVEASGCVAIPDALSFEEAAPLFCAGFTVMSGYRRAMPRPGDRVAVLGLGGLGHLGLQIAKAFGHEVVAVTSSADKRNELIALGADEVVLAGDDAGRALAEAGGADVILATTSSRAHVGQIIAGLRPEGRMALIGLGGGAISIDPMSLILAQGTIVGALQDDRAHLVEVLDLCARRRVRPMLETYPLVLIERAMQRLADGRVRYRAVLTL